MSDDEARPQDLSPPYRPPDSQQWANRTVQFTFRARLHNGSSSTAKLAVDVPLSPAEAQRLEHTLQAVLSLPPFVTVFSIVRSDEAFFAPPLPLLLIHGIVDNKETCCSVDCICRPIIQARPNMTLRPALPSALPVEALLRARRANDELALRAAGEELLTRLRRDRVVRLRTDDATASAVAKCYAALPAFFARPRHVKARLHCEIGARPGDRSYAGMGEDCGREWLQLRRRYLDGTRDDGSDGVCLPGGVPQSFEGAFEHLREVAAACVHALALAVDASPNAWLALGDLDQQSGCRPPPPSQVNAPTAAAAAAFTAAFATATFAGGVEAAAATTAAAAQPCRGGGPSVLRLYRYLPAGQGTGCHAHSDLGLLTLSPCPSSPALLVYDPEALEWLEAERRMQPDELTLFGGEQLAFLSGGLIPAPLHRVPAPPKEAGTRYSMPFFARCHPEVTLLPRRSGAAATSAAASAAVGQHRDHPSPRAGEQGVPCAHFVVKQLFRRRPWRQKKAEDVDDRNGEAPDY